MLPVTWSLASPGHYTKQSVASSPFWPDFSDLGLPTLSWTQRSMLEYRDLLGPALTTLLCSAGNGAMKGHILPSLLTASEHWTTGVLVLHEVLERGATWALLPGRTFEGGLSESLTLKTVFTGSFPSSSLSGLITVRSWEEMARSL